jgi:hypothetical protein
VTYRVWFSNVGASQTPSRPWAVQKPDGSCFLAADVTAVTARTVYRDSGFTELPYGPRGYLECSGVVMTDAVPLVQA